MNEIENGEIINSCLPEQTPGDNVMPVEDSLGASMGATVKMGKVFRDVIYNQKEVGDYSCTTHGSCTAVSAITGLRLSLSFRAKCWAKQIANGANPRVGDYISNAAKVVCAFFNDDPEVETILDSRAVSVNESSIVNSIDQGYPIIAGVQYGPKFWTDEQDDGELNNDANLPGNGGHCITIVKYWYTDAGDFMIKYIENYNGHFKYNIITVNFSKKSKFFFKDGVQIFIKK